MKEGLIAQYEAAFGTPSLELIFIREYITDERLPALMEAALARNKVLTDGELVAKLGPHYFEGIR